MDRHELFRALRLTGWIVALACLAATVAPHLLPARFLLALSAHLATPHPPGSCPFCGMTTGFIAIAHGDLPAATRANAASVPLYFVLLVVPLGALAATFTRRIARSLHPSHSWRPPCP
jgi:Protein of unknown function (DUF2752)